MMLTCLVFLPVYSNVKILIELRTGWNHRVAFFSTCLSIVGCLEMNLGHP